ncbi:gamma-glutamyltransferase [Terrimonas sp.]|uniref:gamma-glutamyltransferase n=1 Tax=Terrimonas sp. TaxID=1914338 RepID=UPI000D508357|nr:gamma-glutamyltransferase [Terrimonas sp.]PVD52162.1 gamma-glutamyltransferase [Terrimonas sp.]
MKKYFFVSTLLVLVFSCKYVTKKEAGALTVNPYAYAIQKKITASNGAVVSAHPLASIVGTEILKQGGNAFDAAIATQLALAVVYPGAGNIGGGGFMVARTNNGENIAIDYREKAPGKASRDMYLDSAGNPLLDKSQNGHLAAGVPGTVAGLFAAMQYAKLPFKQLIQPAIELAQNGFALTEAEAASLNSIQADLKALNTQPNAFQKQTAWKAGDTLLQKDLALTLTRIRDEGKKGFYEGETAKLIVEEMKRANGIISPEDLKNYEAAERNPVVFNYKDYQIISMPLPSSGGIIIQQCLRMIEDKNIGAMGFHSAAAMQLMIEAERRSYADRAEYMGDADFVKVPVKTLVSDAYTKERMKDFIPGKAGSSQQTKAGTTGKESEETTHLSIVDKWGNMVAVTTTLNGGYGSRTVVGGAGFFLNNEMDDFSVKPGVPNMYGALGTEANAIQPGKRMLSSMTPTIVLKHNQPFIVVGTPGGTTIPTSVFQSILNVTEFGLNAEDAVNKPKFHHQWMPDVVYVERDFPLPVIDSLKAMGYTIEQRGQIGRTELIRIHKGSTDSAYTFEAIADKRGDDDAEAY